MQTNIAIEDTLIIQAMHVTGLKTEKEVVEVALKELIAHSQVDTQIAQGRYSSTSEYMHELIRSDERLKAEEQLEAKLLEGLNSPESELKGEDWKEIRKEALILLESRRARR